MEYMMMLHIQIEAIGLETDARNQLRPLTQPPNKTTPSSPRVLALSPLRTPIYTHRTPRPHAVLPDHPSPPHNSHKSINLSLPKSPYPSPSAKGLIVADQDVGSWAVAGCRKRDRLGAVADVWRSEVIESIPQ